MNFRQLGTILRKKNTNHVGNSWHYFLITILSQYPGKIHVYCAVEFFFLHRILLFGGTWLSLQILKSSHNESSYTGFREQNDYRIGLERYSYLFLKEVSKRIIHYKNHFKKQLLGIGRKKISGLLTEFIQHKCFRPVASFDFVGGILFCFVLVCCCLFVYFLFWLLGHTR